MKERYLAKQKTSGVEEDEFALCLEEDEFAHCVLAGGSGISIISEGNLGQLSGSFKLYIT